MGAMEGLAFATCRRGDDDHLANLAILDTPAVPDPAARILGGTVVTEPDPELASIMMIWALKLVPCRLERRRRT